MEAIRPWHSWIKQHENAPNPYDHKMVQVKYHNQTVGEVNPLNTGWHPLFNVASVKWRTLPTPPQQADE